MSRPVVRITLCGALALSVALSCSSSQWIEGRCRAVVDGDSLYLEGYEPQIRLWGVDAPERNEPGYDRARQQLRTLAYQRQLQCKRVDTDRYGRTVARCFVDSGEQRIDINGALVASGVAREYCYFTDNFYGTCRD